MPIRIPSHLYRNRHGTFYFRLVIPADLRQAAQRHEIRLSLHTEQRQAAILTALPLMEDRPLLLADLRRMADNDETAPPNYFNEWRDMLFKNTALKARIKSLKADLDKKDEIIAGMVPASKAKIVAQIWHDKGQLHGKKELEERLIFPWPAEKTKHFTELHAAYMKSFTHRAEGGVKKPPTRKTIEAYEKDIGFFIFAMKDIRIGEISRELAGEYFAILRKLPGNLSRIAKYRGKEISELLAMGDPPQSESNASKKMERVSTMFEWALEEKRTWGIDANPFRGYGQASNNESARRPFTCDELRALLSHPAYLTKHFRSTYSFWLIPLAVFTGARLGELCQLELKDFVEIDGVPCIDINDINDTAAPGDEEKGTRGKHVKNANAKRLVPIHPELVRMGLLRYVETLREKGQIKFFHDLNHERRDGPAQGASNWFQGFRDRAGLTEKQATVFHSFRHLFITRILDAGTAPHLLAPVVGHEAELVTGKVYWNTRDATKRKPTVEAFKLPPELLTMFPCIEDVTFTKKQGAKAKITS